MNFKCKNCTKYRVRNLKCNKSNIPVYVNSKGNKWKKDVCPTCVKLSKSKLTKQQRYLKKKLEEEKILDVEMNNYHPDRKCKKCTKPLTLDRWNHCGDCYVIKCINEDYLYFENSVDTLSKTDLTKHFGL